MRQLLLACCLLATAPAATVACPVCDQETGRRVRAGLFDERFGFNLFATALPFGVFLGIAAAIRFGLPGPRDGRTPPRTEGGSAWLPDSTAGP